MQSDHQIVRVLERECEWSVPLCVSFECVERDQCKIDHDDGRRVLRFEGDDVGALMQADILRASSHMLLRSAAALANSPTGAV